MLWYSSETTKHHNSKKNITQKLPLLQHMIQIRNITNGQLQNLNLRQLLVRRQRRQQFPQLGERHIERLHANAFTRRMRRPVLLRCPPPATAFLARQPNQIAGLQMRRMWRVQLLMLIVMRQRRQTIVAPARQHRRRRSDVEDADRVDVDAEAANAVVVAAAAAGAVVGQHCVLAGGQPGQERFVAQGGHAEAAAVVAGHHVLDVVDHHATQWDMLCLSRALCVGEKTRCLATFVIVGVVTQYGVMIKYLRS